jgi:ribosomal protein S18 acetylase RimI-like enzyme
MGSMSGEQEYVIRPLTAADEPLLCQMLYFAVYVPEGQPLPEPDVVDRPEIARYVRDWGQANDRGFVALHTVGEQAIGAAWLRLLRGDKRGFGYVDDTTPELSVAVLPEYRGQGIGTRLLTWLLQVAAEHQPAVSLSVAAENPALRLYRRLGFDVVGTSGTSLTMKKTLRPDEGV